MKVRVEHKQEKKPGTAFMSTNMNDYLFETVFHCEPERTSGLGNFTIHFPGTYHKFGGDSEYEVQLKIIEKGPPKPVITEHSFSQTS